MEQSTETTGGAVPPPIRGIVYGENDVADKKITNLLEFLKLIVYNTCVNVEVRLIFFSFLMEACYPDSEL